MVLLHSYQMILIVIAFQIQFWTMSGLIRKGVGVLIG